MTKKVACFGNPVYDLILTPSSHGLNRVLSGCSTNACLALSKLGVTSFLIGSVGNDYSAMLRNDLVRRGIEFELYESNQTGGFKLEYYDNHGNRNLSVLGVADEIQVVPLPFLKDIDFIILGPILGEIKKDFGSFLSKSTSAPILFDPQGALRKIKDGKVVHEISEDFVELARVSTILKANELETETVTGISPRSNPRKAVEALHKYGARISIVTLADAGSIIFDGNQFVEIPAYATNAVDPTGAGDTYAAGFSYKFLENPQELWNAGCFASSVASIMVENTGPDFPLTLAEATQRMNSLLERSLKLKIN